MSPTDQLLCAAIFLMWGDLRKQAGRSSAFFIFAGFFNAIAGAIGMLAGGQG